MLTRFVVLMSASLAAPPAVEPGTVRGVCPGAPTPTQPVLATLSVQAEATSIWAAHDNADEAGMLVSVLCPDGMPVTELSEVNFDVVVGIGRTRVLVTSIRELLDPRAKGVYDIRFLPESPQWRRGTHVLSVRVSEGGFAGAAVVSLRIP